MKNGDTLKCPHFNENERSYCGFIPASDMQKRRMVATTKSDPTPNTQ